jgi:Ca-activated chloride channel family protein
MNTHRTGAVALALIGLLASAPVHAAGLLTPVGKTTSLEIRDHRVNVVVEDGYVVTQVDQVFANHGDRDVEAHYTFPVPAHAAVSEFTYWIDGQPVHGEVLKKAQARQLYEDERAAGREVALAEKDEYRTFDMLVSPVRAGGDVRLRLVYLQRAQVDSGIGRYVYPLEDGGVDEERIAFWDTRDEVSQQFAFNFELKSSYPIDALRVPAQAAATPEKLADGHWRVSLRNRPATANGDFDQQIAQIEEGQSVVTPAAPVAAAKLDEDIVIYWRHAAGLPGSVDLVAHKRATDARGTFMLTLTPGDDLPVIENGRDWVFVLDVSGSMSGKFATLADGVQKALGKLNPEDRFRIYTFSNATSEITSGFVPATVDRVRHYVDLVGRLQSGGGTNLYAGLSAGLDGLDSDRTSGIALVTDGVANVGVTQKKEFLDLLARRDVRLFTFILGNSANRPLLEAMTEVSNGFAMQTSNSDDISGQLLQAIGKIRHAALNDVSLRIDGVKVADLTPARIGSLYHGEQLNVLGHYFKAGTATVELTGKVQGQPVRYATSFAFPDAVQTNPELERLWAYATIENLQASMDYLGEDADTRDAIVDLAVEYGLVTDHTSMIVVRDEVFAANGIKRSNRERVDAERAARAQRESLAPVDRRADRAQPMYQSSRPSTGSGGGAFGLPVLLALGLLAARRLRGGGA